MQATWLILTLIATLVSARGVNAQNGPQPPSNYEAVVTAHAIIDYVAWVIFFLMGSIMIRLMNGSKAWLLHACIVSFGWAMVLLLSCNATEGEDIAYGVIAVIIWVSWIVTAIAVPTVRCNEIPGTINREKRVSSKSARAVTNDSPEGRSERGPRAAPRSCPKRNGITVNFRQ